MILIIEIIILIVLVLVSFWLVCLIYAQALGAPTVYSNSEAIIDAFKLANLKPKELVVDLGCGNGKSLIIAAKKFGAKGVGVERSPYCFLIAKMKVFLAGENKNIKIIFGDFKKAESYIKKADVVYLYLLNSVLKNIEDWLFSNIKNNARVVSLAFQFPEHKPKQIIETTNLGRETKVRMY